MTGPGEALLMAAAGRRSALDDLTGDGLSTLRERVEQGLTSADPRPTGVRSYFTKPR